MRRAFVLTLAAVALPASARAQDGGVGEPRVEILVVSAAEAWADPALEPAASPAITLAAGERIAVRVESEVEVGDREIGPGPVADATVGDLIARFGSSGAFAWPAEPTVWIAPEGGELTFDVNAYPAHRARGAARIEVLRL